MSAAGPPACEPHGCGGGPTAVRPLQFATLQLIKRSPRALLFALAVFSIHGTAAAQSTTTPRFELELEGSAIWQSRNDVEIPNDGSATRFSLEDLVGAGPWPQLGSP